VKRASSWWYVCTVLCDLATNDLSLQRLLASLRKEKCDTMGAIAVLFATILIINMDLAKSLIRRIERIIYKNVQDTDTSSN